ncbi:hypothetical protein DR740_07970, partial [Campylobacter lari]|nr:hypothetical protein [Campylobacter lari]
KIFLLSPSSGTVAIQFTFLPNCKMNLNHFWVKASEIYSCLYHMKNDDIEHNMFRIPNSITKDHAKNLFLIQNKVNAFFVCRDPLSIIKHALNHIGAYNMTKITKKMKQINLVSGFYFPSIYYQYSKNYKPNLESIYDINFDVLFLTRKRLEILKPIIKNIECIEFSQINTTNAFNTFTKLAHKYGFTPPNDPILFQGRVNRNQG